MHCVKRAFGAPATSAAVAQKSTYDEIEHELGVGRPYWHVHMMAVHEKQRGRGRGSRVLVQAFAPCAAQPVPFVPATHREVNVVFYRRPGFDLVDQRTMKSPGGESYTVWLTLVASGRQGRPF